MGPQELQDGGGGLLAGEAHTVVAFAGGCDVWEDHCNRAAEPPLSHAAPSAATQLRLLPALSSPLAALHASMERARAVLRAHRALCKQPQARNSIDVSVVAAETGAFPAFTRGGPGLHRDLCHVVKAVRLDKGEAAAAAQALGGAAFAIVLQGSVEIRTHQRDGYDAPPPHLVPAAPPGARTSADGAQPLNTGGAAGGAGSREQPGAGPSAEAAAEQQAPAEAPLGPVKASEEDLRALFSSIDVDGSGAGHCCILCACLLGNRFCGAGCSACAQRRACMGSNACVARACVQARSTPRSCRGLWRRWASRRAPPRSQS